MLCSKCSAHVNPVAVFDIDGTLADYHGHFFAFADLWLGGVAPTYGNPGRAEAWAREYEGNESLSTFMGLDLQEYRAIKLAYRQGGMKRMMPPNSGMPEVTRWASALGYEVWIATTRPYNRLDNIDPDTQEWLRRNKVHYDHLLYGDDDDKYQRLVEQVDPERVLLVLEDLPDLFDDAAALGLPVVQYGSRYNSHTTATRVPRIHSDRDVVDILNYRRAQWVK